MFISFYFTSKLFNMFLLSCFSSSGAHRVMKVIFDHSSRIFYTTYSLPLTFLNGLQRRFFLLSSVRCSLSRSATRNWTWRCGQRRLITWHRSLLIYVSLWWCLIRMKSKKNWRPSCQRFVFLLDFQILWDKHSNGVISDSFCLLYH